MIYHLKLQWQILPEVINRKHLVNNLIQKKEHQQIQQDEISKTRQVKITAEPEPSRKKPLIIITGDSS